jgi:tRNA-dihydrouridine synthase A
MRDVYHSRPQSLAVGLSPKENREIPPLDYPRVYQLKRDFPHLTMAINGGIKSLEEAKHHLQHMDGVMVGREAYQNPRHSGVGGPGDFWRAASDADPVAVVRAMYPYIEARTEQRDLSGPCDAPYARAVSGDPRGAPVASLLSENAHKAGADYSTSWNTR